jgi:hypothetical protein
MRRSLRTAALLAITAALVPAALAPAPARAAAPTWRLEQPAAPGGSPYAAPLGVVGDLDFRAPNRGVLTTGGTDLFPAGLYTYDGASWHQLATVCGGAGAQVAWAGPHELWTVADPAIPAQGISAVTLCHIVDGQVVGSYGVPDSRTDSYALMTAAACRGPADCWFAGIARTSADGRRRGTFHLHFDGASLLIVDAPYGRGVTDLVAHRGALVETLVNGAEPFAAKAAVGPVEAVPHLVQRINPDGFAADPFLPAPAEDVPADGVDLLGADSDGDRLWIAGGGSSSGADGRGEEPVLRAPLLATATDGALSEIPLGPLPGGAALPADARPADVAAIPGSDEAWVALERSPEHASAGARARLLRVRADGAVLEDVRLPDTGQVLGAAYHLACPAPADCWMITSRGWLFHWTDGTQPPVDADPAFAGIITARPADGRTPQYTPDALPIDDSQLFAPPATEEPPAPTVEATGVTTTRLPALMRQIRTKVVRRTLLVVSFRLTRPARVGLVASRRGHIVARAKQRLLAPGKRELRVKLNRRHWPTKLRFAIKETTAPSTPANDQNVVGTG